MTPDRLAAILTALRWSYTTAGEAMGLSYATVSRAARGLLRLPPPVEQGLEEMAAALERIRASKPERDR